MKKRNKMNNGGKLLNAAAAIIVAVLGFTNSATAQTWNCGATTNVGGASSVTAVLDESGTLTISGTGAMANYINGINNTPWYSYRTNITKIVVENGVTTIGEWAFSGCSGLTGTLTIPNSVTSIGQRAFWNCSGLTSVTIGNSVTTIGEWAFSGCSGLTEITIPDCVTSIGNGAFWNCSGLTSLTIGSGLTDISGFNYIPYNFYYIKLTSISVSSENNYYSSENGVLFNKNKTTLVIYPRGKLGAYTIPNSVTTIGQYAFEYCSELTSVNIPNSVTSIGYYAFRGCSGLTGTLTIPNSVTSIEQNAFSSCSGLTSLTIGSSVMTIGHAAFSGCSGITGTLTIPNSVTSIGDAAFYGCSGLTSVSIPNSVTSIKNRTFSGCTGLTSLTIGSGVTSIEQEAFLNCSGLTSLTIGNSVTSIGQNAFNSCSGLTSLTIGNSVTYIGGGAFWNCSGLTSLTIGNSVTYIADGAFSGCSRLIGTLTIPNSVTTIGAFAFRGCSGLTGTLTIPNSVTSIRYEAFSGCSGLTGTLTIGNSVTSIGKGAFYDCNGLTSLTIGSSVTTIEDDAFYRCIGLKQIINRQTTPQKVNNSTFRYVTTSSVKLFVPAQSLAAYKAANVWKDFNTMAPFTLSSTSAMLDTTNPNKTLTVQFNSAYTGDKTMTWTSSNPSVVSVNNGVITKVSHGTAIITAATVDGLYDICTVEVMSIKIPKPTTATNLVYNGSMQSAKIATNTLYTITGDTTGTNAGSYTAIVVLNDKNNYEWADSTDSDLTLQWQIEKGNPAHTIPTGLTAAYGQTLADIVLPDGWSWESTLTTLVGGAGTQTHKASFTPDDLDNYNVLSNINVNILVAKVAGAAVDAPTLASRTHNSIKITKVVAPTNGQSVKYAINTANVAPTNWQTPLAFNGLEPNTTYYIFARAAENDNYFAGAISAALEVTTDVPTPIKDIQKSDKKHGVLLKNNIVSDNAEMLLVLPNNESVISAKIAIYDNVGNAVFETTSKDGKAIWNLTNTAGKSVANGTYLVVAEVKGISGKVYAYSAKLGVRR